MSEQAQEIRKTHRIRTLFFHEMRANAWFLLIGILVSLTSLLYLYGNITSKLGYMDVGIAGSILMESVLMILTWLSMGFWVGIAALTTVQFYGQKSERTGEFMTQLPYRKRELFWMKYAVGVLTFTIPILLFLIGSMCIRMMFYEQVLRVNAFHKYFEYVKANETVGNLVLNVAVFWLSCMALYSVYMLMQIWIHPPLVATAVGMLAVLAPLYIVRQMVSMVYEWREALNEISGILNIWFGKALGGRVTVHSTAEYVNIFVFEKLPEHIWLFIAITFGSVTAAFLTNAKRATSGRNVFAFPTLKWIFLICFGTCFGLITVTIFGVSLFACIIVGCVSIILAKQAIDRYSV